MMFLMIVAHGTDVSDIFGGHTEAVEAIKKLLRPLRLLRGCSKPMVVEVTVVAQSFEF